ncbi:MULTISPECIES: aminoglycoside phosphotransferase family protein [unclassified Micromonospora]|uniref:phosphotransferase enzyme family protein n=1 Tax=unclassified Micromonospora TaxID=2617518 RepID=UPI0022B64B7B|nr:MULTISPECIES: aminoglycoside phosphotransferase family protein [unclassified Micromonospora]MCZ7472777.1 aminoglycoside phosphotransferase family protein [Micromonospora sp. WMMC273]WBC03473.1 aminoglycoside phosphotransferase family protein [Micromonospora sp. WMMA1976]
MIDKPDIDERTLAAEVAAAWPVDVVDLVFMPVGLDGQAWAYRVETSDGGRYFLKVRRGDFTPAAVLLPGLLRAQGLRQVVAPLDRPDDGAGRGFGDYRLLLYPFHDGGSLWGRGLTDRQWIEYGEFLGRLHRVTPSAEVAAVLPAETYRSSAAERLRTLGGQAATSEVLGAFWARHGAALHRLAETVDDLASRVAPGQHVICHADIHPGNLIADGDGPLHVVDWDAPILAPRERDLMFVYSADFGDHPINGRRAELFREGYGPLEPDPVLLRYYRSERHLDDVAAFLGSILDPEASTESRANDLHWLTRIAEAVAGPGYAP